MPKKQFDLHIHTYYSDGKDSPETILKRVKKAKLALVSITDHNSLNHLAEERWFADKVKVNLLSGVELSTVYQGRHLHLLGYNFHRSSPELKTVLKKIQSKRRRGILKIAAKLRNLGFDIQDRELAKLRTEYYGLAHIIRILLHKPAEKRRILKEVGSSDIFAIIKFYFSEAKEAYVPEDYMPTVKMIRLIKSAGGITSLAHPGSHLRFREDRLIESLKAGGLDALEAFTPKHNWDQVVHYQILAKRLNLAITAGSNYHEDFHHHDIPVVTPIGFMKTPPEVFDRFMEFLEKHTDYRRKY